MKPPRAIVLIIPNLCGGGAERVMVNMARWWCERGTELTLITFREATVYTVPPDVRRLFLDDIHVESPCLPMWPAEATNVARLRLALMQTPVHAPIISFLSRMNLRTLLAARGLERRVLVSERCWPPMCPLDAAAESLRRKLYPEAFRVVMQTECGAHDWAADLVPVECVRVIPNALVHRQTARQNVTPLPRRFLLASGRLEEQKNFATLIDAFAGIAPVFTDLSLLIAGEGTLRSELEARAAKYGLAERVLLPGFVPDLRAYCAQAEAFVLTSAFEGFPNVLLEAMAEGCPAVAFDCPTGPAEIIRHGIDGLLVPLGDMTALSTALTQILRKPALRNSLAQRAREVRQRFAENTIMEQWNMALWEGLHERSERLS